MNIKHENSNNRIVRRRRMLLFAVLMALITAFACGCGGSGTESDHCEVLSPDLRYYNNGYDTYFVVGTRIEHPADTSTSIVVDWSRAPAAKASENLKISEEKHIIYSHDQVRDGRDEGQPLDLRLNLMVPADSGSASQGSEALHPVVLLQPGGGFISCRIDDKYVDVQRYLAEHGYAVAIMEYHAIGQGRYCDAADDVRSAVRWIGEHGREHGLDPDRVALMGNSAGGYVAALAACQGIPGESSGKDPAPGDGQNAESAIRCVVNFYGLSDLLNNKADYEDAAIEAHHKPNSSDSQFVNGVLSGKGLTDDPEEAEKADPATYINGDEPPFLHLHGDADLLVSPSQSVHLHDALTEAGVESTRYSVKDAGHGDPQFRTTEAMDLVIDFLDRNCGKGR